MKGIFSTLTLFLFTFTVLAQTDPDAYTKKGDQAPQFDFEIQKGKMVKFSDYKGKLVLINLFATWCGPCNAELPLMQKNIWEKYEKNPEFALFVFGREENWDILDPYKKKKGFTFPVLPDPKREIFSKFAKQYIPRNILVDENGKIIYQSMGFTEKEFKELEELIHQKLTAKKN